MKGENEEALKAAGLTGKEAAAYMDLVRYGDSRTGEICSRTKIPSSHIYSILSTLQEKGLANYKLVNNVKIFGASDPDALARLFEEKEKAVREEREKLVNAISRIRVLPQKEGRFANFRYFRGTRGIKALYMRIANSWKKGDEYCIASAPYGSFNKLEGFFLNVLHKKRAEDKVSLKIIINNDSREWGKAREKMPLTQVRYLDVGTETEYGVLKDYFFMVNYAEEPYGVLAKDAAFANTYRAFFDILWKSAKASP